MQFEQGEPYACGTVRESRQRKLTRKTVRRPRPPPGSRLGAAKQRIAELHRRGPCVRVEHLFKTEERHEHPG
jgi:hypothetical protein